MKKNYILFVICITYLLNVSAWKADEIGFVNRTKDPITVIFLKKHCVDDGINCTHFTIPPVGPSKIGKIVNVKVSFENNIVLKSAHNYWCTKSNKWVYFKAVRYGQNRREILIGHITYKANSSHFSRRIFAFKDINKSSGVDIGTLSCNLTKAPNDTKCMLFNPSV